ncbi:MAG: acyl carrier protein [Muribaculaceae bacterium]
MEKEELKRIIRTILNGVLKHNNFDMSDEMSAKDVDGWDSLSHMAIISKIEEHFNIRFKLRELNKLKNMGTLIELIQSKL